MTNWPACFYLILNCISIRHVIICQSRYSMWKCLTKKHVREKLINLNLNTTQKCLALPNVQCPAHKLLCSSTGPHLAAATKKVKHASLLSQLGCNDQGSVGKSLPLHQADRVFQLRWMGMKMCSVNIYTYLSIFSRCARLATCPWPVTVLLRWLVARV